MTGRIRDEQVDMEGVKVELPSREEHSRPTMSMGPMSHQSDPSKRIPRRGEDASRPLGFSQDNTELYTSNENCKQEIPALSFF